MLAIESPADRAGLFYDGADIALFAKVPDALDEEGAATVIIERNVTCRFDRAYLNVNGHESYHPVMLCTDEDMAFIQKDHRVMLKGYVFKLEKRLPDGMGLTQCVLKILGKYRFDPDDPSVLQGFPYILPMVLGGPSVISAGNPIAVNEGNLAYPYTVLTYLNETGDAVSL